MEHSVLIAAAATLLFCGYKFIDMRYLDKKREFPALKFFVRDVIAVFICTLVSAIVQSNYTGSISEFMNTITETKAAVIGTAPAQVFTDDPGF